MRDNDSLIDNVCGFCGKNRPIDGDCPNCMSLWEEPGTYANNAQQVLSIIDSYAPAEGPDDLDKPSPRAIDLMKRIAGCLPDGRFEVFEAIYQGIGINSQMDGIDIRILVNHYDGEVSGWDEEELATRRLKKRVRQLEVELAETKTQLSAQKET